MGRFKFFVFLIFLLGGFSLNGQTYQPLIRPNTFWDDTGYDIESGPCLFVGLRRYEFAGDTLIEGKVYQKILAYEFAPVHPPVFCPPFQVNAVGNLISYAFLREDVEQRQVFIWDANAGAGGQEFLLYDFSLEVGDTLFSDYMEIEAKEVIAVDSVQLLSGDWRKRIFLEGMQELFYMEGIGSNLGLFRMMDFPIGPATELLCVRENGVPVWGTSCGPEFVTSTLEVSDLPFSIFPNPARDEVTLRTEIPLPIQVEVYSIERRLQLSVSGSQELQIPVQGLSPGIYWLKVSSETGGLMGVEKIMVLRD